MIVITNDPSKASASEGPVAGWNFALFNPARIGSAAKINIVSRRVALATQNLRAFIPCPPSKDPGGF
ncbi:MAG: hypothetical protein R6W95_12505 [Desulfosarcina sp.]